MTVVAGTRKVRDGLVLSFDAQNKKSLNTGNNLINPGTWAVGTGSATGFSANGTTEENHRILGTDPFGNTNVVVWEARPEGISGADGGWNGSYFSIDNTKMYRFSVWVKRNSNADGRFYLGLNAGGTSNLLRLRTNVASTTTNPYFWNSITGFIVDEWELVVGHVWPAGTQTGSNHDDSGRYRVGSGKIGNISTDYVWHEGNTSSRHRSYLYYSTNITQRQQFVYPRVDLIDGTEPSIDDLLNNRVGNFYDASGIGTNGALLNLPVFDGQGVVFDGLDDRVELSSVAALPTGTSDRTVLAFVRTPTSFSQNFLHIIHWGVSTTGNAFGMAIRASDSLLNTHTWSNAPGQGTLSPNTMYFLAVTYTHSDAMHRCWINGVSQGTGVALAINTGASQARIGSRIGPIAENWSPNGKIYSVAVYNRALTDEEIRKNFLASKSRFGL